MVAVVDQVQPLVGHDASRASGPVAAGLLALGALGVGGSALLGRGTAVSTSARDLPRTVQRWVGTLILTLLPTLAGVASSVLCGPLGHALTGAFVTAILITCFGPDPTRPPRAPGSDATASD